MKFSRVGVLALAISLVTGACSGSSKEPAKSKGDTDASSSQDSQANEQATMRQIIETLASDKLEGRNNNTAGGQAARQYLLDVVGKFAEPLRPDLGTTDGYLQEFAEGSNILAVVKGSELPDEYVMVGAHYDHLGNECATPGEPDQICNGAADNAAGVAEAIEIVRSIAKSGSPRRSVILALWDAEEDGLLGSRAYVAAPIVPLEKITTYINFDIQGTNLLPSLRNLTVLVGAETGGVALQAAAKEATKSTSLQTLMLSLLFGQGRSDHAPMAAAGVPSVFFTDANNGCYHGVQDDVDHLDFDKLDQQLKTSKSLAEALIATDHPASYNPDAPQSTYEDAVSMLAVVKPTVADFDILTADQQASANQYITDLEAIVAAGPDKFDDAANATLLGGAVTLVTTLASLPCDSYKA